MFFTALETFFILNESTMTSAYNRWRIAQCQADDIAHVFYACSAYHR